MVFFRWFFGLPLAALVTAGLFALMAGLIKMDRGIDDPKPYRIVDILPKIKETPPDDGETVKPDPLPKDPPPIDIKRTLPGDKPNPVPVKPAGPDIDGDPDYATDRYSGAVITFAPPYPESCRSRGVEGIVIVQFDITPEGNVVNVQIIDAPDRCFNRIASTIAKWKYPPAYENGRPVMRYNVIEQFRFELTE